MLASQILDVIQSIDFCLTAE